MMIVLEFKTTSDDHRRKKHDESKRSISYVPTPMAEHSQCRCCLLPSDAPAWRAAGNRATEKHQKTICAPPLPPMAQRAHEGGLVKRISIDMAMRIIGGSSNDNSHVLTCAHAALATSNTVSPSASSTMKQQQHVTCN